MNLPQDIIDVLHYDFGENSAGISGKLTLTAPEKKKEERLVKNKLAEAQEIFQIVRIVYLLNINDPKKGTGHTFAEELGELQNKENFLSENVQKSPQGSIANQLIDLLPRDKIPLRETYAEVHNWKANLLIPAVYSEHDKSKQIVASFVIDPTIEYNYKIVRYFILSFTNNFT